MIVEWSRKSWSGMTDRQMTSKSRRMKARNGGHSEARGESIAGTTCPAGRRTGQPLSLLQVHRNRRVKICASFPAMEACFHQEKASIEEKRSQKRRGEEKRHTSHRAPPRLLSSLATNKRELDFKSKLTNTKILRKLMNASCHHDQTTRIPYHHHV